MSGEKVVSSIDNGASCRAMAFRVERVVLGVCVVVAVAALGFSLWVEPGCEGGRGLGLGPCPVLAETGRPCLTCGMTTAFAYGARLQWGGSIGAQPFGWLLFVLTMTAGAGSLYALARRRSLTRAIGRLHPATLPVATVVLYCLMIGSWLYKTQH